MQLRVEARAGRLDREAVKAVIAAAGPRPAASLRSSPTKLSEREVEVLRLIVGGRSNRQVAEQLGISAKAVGHHVQHIYSKIGVSTRAGAAVFALEHGILPH
jgi:DNA-binding NarL/FixJ family response regulator